MSDCITVEAHLAKFGVTVQQAKDFINSNIQSPGNIFQAARDYGVTTEMLSKLSGYSVDIVREYLEITGKNSRNLDYTHIMINSDLGSLEFLIAINERNIFLSNTSLKESVLSKLGNSFDYEEFIKPTKPYQASDGIYDAEELGTCGSSTSIPATTESLESLFYGSLINMFSRLDDTELNQIIEFPDKESDQYRSLLIADLNSPSTTSRSDADLANLVVNEATNTINNFWEGVDPDTHIVDYRTGLLDFGLLGNI